MSESTFSELKCCPYCGCKSYYEAVSMTVRYAIYHDFDNEEKTTVDTLPTEEEIQKKMNGDVYCLDCDMLLGNYITNKLYPAPALNKDEAEPQNKAISNHHRQRSLFAFDYHVHQPSDFVGTFPVCLSIDGEDFPVRNWADTGNIILRKAAEDTELRSNLYSLADRFRGNKRVLISSSPDNMDRPQQIYENLFFEGKIGTMQKLITIQEILRAIGYDYTAHSFEIELDNRRRKRK